MKARLAVAFALVALLAAAIVWVPRRGPAPDETFTGPSAESIPAIQAPRSEPEATEVSPLPVRAEIPVEPDPELDLHGAVATTEGDPVRGALLRVVQPLARHVRGVVEDESRLDRAVAETRSDADGRFRFRLERWTVYDLFAEAEGFASVKLPDRYAGEFVRVVLPRAGSISGLVLDVADGTPVAGAIVSARLGVVHGLGDPRFESTTDETGRYALRDLSAGAYVLTVHAPFHESSPNSISVVQEGAQTRRDFRLERGRKIRGRVTDGLTKEPIAGAKVRWSSWPQRFSVRTDDEGRYEIAVATPGNWEGALVVSAKGYGDFQFEPGGVPEEGLKQDFFLMPGRRARGRLVDSHGVPVAYAYVATSCSGHAYGASQSEKRYARSDADGRFTIEDLRQDLRHTLIAFAEGFATTLFDFPEREWSELEIDLGDLRMEPAGAISGRLLDFEGRPLPELFVTLNGEPRRRDDLGPSFAGNEGYASFLGLTNVSARTDALGRYAFRNLPAGAYWLSGGAKGCARAATLETSIEEGETLERADLYLELGLSITGVVVDESGSPYPGGSVEVYDSPEAFGHVTYNLTSAAGEFSLHGLEARPYWIEAHPSGLYTRETCAVTNSGRAKIEPPAAGVRFVLSAAEPIAGIVTDLDGVPVKGAGIWERVGEGPAFSGIAVTDHGGRFTICVKKGSRPHLAVYPPPATWFERVDLGGILAGTTDLVVRLPRRQ